MTAVFIGREHELAVLSELYQQDKFQLFILYGRRRIGKTTLLKEFCKDKSAIFYSAEQSNDYLNLQKFSERVLEHYGEKNISPFSSWEKAIMYISERQKESPLVLVFDEFPYLAGVNKAMLSMLQQLIDHQLQSGKLFVVLCGSYLGFMEKEVLGAKSPLFGRRTAQMRLKPLDYLAASSFFSEYSFEEKLLLYGIMGGTPLYLKQIACRKPLADNIRRILLQPDAYLYEEPLLLLKQEVQEPNIYSAIIEAIAGGHSRGNEIATKTGEPLAKCLKYINTLVELGIVRKEMPFGETTSRRTIYSLADFLFRFWYRYVFTNKTLLETGGADIVFSKRVEPDLSNYMGLAFEQVCREYLLRMNKEGRLPLLFTDIGRWWGTGRERGQEEIDIVAADGENWLFGECKWRNELMEYSVLDTLRKKSLVFGKKCRSSWYFLFSKRGFSPALKKAARQENNVILVGLADLFAPSEQTKKPGRKRQ